MNHVLLLQAKSVIILRRRAENHAEWSNSQNRQLLSKYYTTVHVKITSHAYCTIIFMRMRIGMAHIRNAREYFISVVVQDTYT